MASKIQRELALLLTGKDISASKAVRGVNSELGKLHQAGAKAGSSVARNIERGVLVGAAAATTAVGFAIKQAMDFESSAASVRKTVDGNIEAILTANRELAKTTGLEVNTLNEISAAAGALGVAKDDVDDFTKTVALLGVTTDDVSTDLGAESLGHLATTLKLADDDFEHVGNTLVHLGNNGASTEGQILSMTENIAGAADVMGASTPQVLGWAAALANTGEEAEAGGSSIQRFWLESFRNVNEGGAKLKLMAKTTGMSAAAFKKAFGKDATGTLAKFITKLGKLSKAEQLATLKALGFTDIRITRALLKLLANTDNLNDSLAESEDGWTKNSAATVEAQKRFETTAAKLAILKANVNDAAITIGSELLPVLADLSTDAVGWISEHQGDIREFSRDLGSGVREAVQWAQKLDWEAIGGGLETAADAGKTLVDAFANAPPWLQGFLTTGFLANKFTGGAVMDVAGILLGQVVRGVLGMNAGVVNIRAGVVNGLGGPVPVGGPGGGGGKSGAGKVLDAASKLLIIGFVAELADLIHEQIKAPPDVPASQLSWPWGPKNTPTILADVFGGNGVLGGTPDPSPRRPTADPFAGAGLPKDRIVPVSDDRAALAAEKQAARQLDTANRVREATEMAHRQGERLVTTEAETAAAVEASKARLAAELAWTRREDTRGTNLVAAAERVTASRIIPAAIIARKGGDAAAAAIRAKDLSVVVNNRVVTNLRFSIRDAQANLTFQQNMQRFG